MGREEDERRALLQGEPKGSANLPPHPEDAGSQNLVPTAPGQPQREGGREGSAEQFFL